MEKVTQNLRTEHDSILFVLKILDKIILDKNVEAESKIRYCNEIVYFLKIFVDKCHQGKEEVHLFKSLENGGVANEDGPISVMLREHRQGRAYIVSMSTALDQKDLNEFNVAAVQYCALIEIHIKKETNILFSITDHILDEETQAELIQKFKQHEEKIIGHGIHEKLHAMIGTWAEAFGVRD